MRRVQLIESDSLFTFMYVVDFLEMAMVYCGALSDDADVILRTPLARLSPTARIGGRPRFAELRRLAGPRWEDRAHPRDVEDRAKEGLWDLEDETRWRAMKGALAEQVEQAYQEFLTEPSQADDLTPLEAVYRDLKIRFG